MVYLKYFVRKRELLLIVIKSDNARSFQGVIQRMDAEERRRAVKEKNQDAATLLHLLAKKPALLKSIIAFYRVEVRLKCVKAKDAFGDTVLHEAAKIAESVEGILALLPNDARLRAVKGENENGDTVLHLAAETPRSVRAILAIYPLNERLQAVKEKNKNGTSVLQGAAKNPDSVNAVLALLRETDLVEVLKSSVRGRPFWQDIFKKSQTEINQLLEGIESPLLRLLVDIKCVKTATRRAGSHFFSSIVGRGEGAFSLATLFKLTSSTEIHSHVIKTLSKGKKRDFNKRLLNKLVLRQGGDAMKLYSEKLTFLKEAWQGLGVLPSTLAGDRCSMQQWKTFVQ